MLHSTHTTRSRSPAGLALLLAAAVLATLAPMPVALAQTPGTRERQIRAAVVYRIARFVTWPANALPATGPFTFCHVSDDATSQVLAGIEGRALQDHRIRMRRLETADPRSVSGCNLLYLTGASMLAPESRAAAIAASTLIVADGPREGDDAAMVQLVPQDNRVTLVVDLARVRVAQLRIDATLLQMVEVRQ